MAPDHPPFPLATNFSFHPDTGSHTSILISESLDGLSVAATLQYAGVFPAAATSCARVIVVSGSFSEARLSHDAAQAATAPNVAATIRAILIPQSIASKSADRRRRR